MTALRRHNAKRDYNEQGIVRALKDMGCMVCRLDTPVDLLIYCPMAVGQRMHLIEVKMPKNDLNDKQRAFKDAGWPVHVIRSADEAIALVKRLREAA